MPPRATTHELAIESPGHGRSQRGLADAGRADEGENDAATVGGVGVWDTAVRTELAHGQVFDQSLLHLDQSGVVGVEDFTSDVEIEPLGIDVAPGEFEHRVQPRSNPVGLHRLVTSALQAIDLLGHGVGCVAREVQLSELGSIVGDRIVAPFSQFLVNGCQLPSENRLPLAFFKPVGHVLADLLGQFHFGQGLFHPGNGEIETLIDLGGLEQLNPSFESQLWPVADRVCERSWFLQAVQRAAEATTPHFLQQHCGRRSVLVDQRFDITCRLLIDRLRLDPGRVARADDTHTDPNSLMRAYGEGRGAVGQRSSVLDRGDHTDSRVPNAGVAGESGQQKHSIGSSGSDGRAGFIGVGRNGDDHVRQHNAIGNREYGKSLAMVGVVGKGRVGGGG